MPSSLSNLTIRLATAAVMTPFILFLLYGVAPIYFYVLIFAATLVGGLEFFRMTHPGDRAAQVVGTAVCAIFSLVVYFYGDDARVLMALVFFLPIQALLLPLWRLGSIETGALRAAAGAFGPLYIGSLTLVAKLLKDRGSEGPGYVLIALMFAWFADSAGYFAGRFLGKHKLYEAVSPKKTIEGAIGGLGGAVLGALFAHFVYLRGLPLSHAIPLALFAGALGEAGDLGESLIKRSTGVKDSGGIVPGHGGILDRVDALLVVTPIVYLYTRIRYG